MIQKKNLLEEVTTQPKNNNLDYTIDPAFRNIWLFDLSFRNDGNDPSRNYFVKGPLSSLTQYLANESPSKMMKNAF